jgi:hypothetical protein
MAEYTITIEDEILEVLKIRAKLEGVTIPDLLQEILADSLEEIRQKMTDPLIGIVDSGKGDLSERDEEIMYGNRRQD